MRLLGRSALAILIWGLGSAPILADAISVEPSADTRVMISIREGDSYPSGLQTTDGAITIRARVTEYGSGKSGVTVYFTLHDPDDQSPYEEGGEGDDNEGTGTLSVSTDVTDEDGYAETVLTISSDAGDNWDVHASLLPVGCGGWAETGVLVAWKRIYVEEDRMYVSGTDLTSDVASSSDTITVDDANGFDVDNVIKIFDADIPDGETATITAKSGNDLTLEEDLTNGYTVARGAAITKSDTLVYDANITRVNDAFGIYTNIWGTDGGCFVEFKWREDGSTNVPYKHNMTLSDRVAFTSVWFQNSSESNYLHLVGAEYASSGAYGISADGSNYNYIYVQRIKDVFGASSETVNADVVAHEFGHQFSLTAVDGSHQNVYCHLGSLTDYCLMDSTRRDRTDAYSEFCFPASGENHIREIRIAPDGL